MKQSQKEKMCKEPSFKVTKVSNTHLTNTKLFVNPMEYKFLCLEKVLQLMTLQWRVFMEFSKKKLCIIHDIKSIEEYQALVEDWIKFYNTKKLKIGRNLKFLPKCFLFK